MTMVSLKDLQTMVSAQLNSMYIRVHNKTVLTTLRLFNLIAEAV